jgi:ribonuclease R
MLTQDQKDQVLQFIRSLKTREFTFRDVVRFLDLDSDHRRSLKHFLDELDSQEIIHRIRRARYTIPERENLVSGVLYRHPDGYGFLIPENRTLYKEDIFIPARGMEDALHEDRVIVKLVRNSVARNSVARNRVAGKKISTGRGPHGRRARKEDKKERTEGYVVRVLERKHVRIVGRYCAHPRYPYAVPLDARISHNVRIPYQASKGARDGQIVSVTITQSPARNQIPQGKVIEILGDSGEPEIEYKIVEHKFGLPVDFSPESLRQTETIPDHVLKEEYEQREDLRQELVITIDGENARDFDDAVSLRILRSGHYLLGVHIADVSHYVRENTPLDMEAYARGTSVYFPDRAIPMLPPRISSGICSLKPNEDRLCLSAFIEIDSKSAVVGKRFTKGVLRSRRRMTYTSVAKILVDRDREERARCAEWLPLLEMMEELCDMLSKKRYRRGAVDFDLPEAEIRFDRNGKVISVLPAERNISHRIIEEFMLLANECVAQTLSSWGGPALYRIHEKPDPLKVNEFAELASSLGYKLENRSGQYRPKDFQKFVMQLEGKAEQRFLTYLMLRSFMQARYSEHNLGHFGLATSEYTHFTSPIRRYPDLFVHRLLKRCIEKDASSAWTQKTIERLPEIALRSSSRERIAEEAEREIERIKKAQFMADKIGEEFDAITLSVSRQGFFIELLNPFVEGFVPFAASVVNSFVYDETIRPSNRRSQRRRFRPGSRIRVRLDNVDMETARLTFSVSSRQY